LDRLQSVQNAAARLVTDLGRREHITPVLGQFFHWLPVRQRVMFKLAKLVHCSLAGTARACDSHFNEGPDSPGPAKLSNSVSVVQCRH